MKKEEAAKKDSSVDTNQVKLDIEMSAKDKKAKAEDDRRKNFKFNRSEDDESTYEAEEACF